MMTDGILSNFPPVPGSIGKGQHTAAPAPGDAAMTFTLDTFHPDRLACDQCGQHFGPVTLDDGDDPATLDSLTEDQVAHRWPLLALVAGVAVCGRVA
jgi:hypothetical protein